MEQRRISFSPLGFVVILLIALGLIAFLAWQAGYLDQVLGLSSDGPQTPIVTNTAAPTPETVELPTPQVQAAEPTPVPPPLPDPVSLESAVATGQRHSGSNEMVNR